MFRINFLNFVNMATAIGNVDTSLPTEGEGWMQKVLYPLLEIVKSILWPVLFILGVVGIVYAITLGVQYAKADSSDKKDKAKDKMINAVVGIVIMLALIVVLLLIIDNLPDIIDWVNGFGKG